MSGHSKWKTIQKSKTANDAKKGKLFSKLSKDIEVATRIGESGDLVFNPTLRVFVDKAKAANMTSEKIQNAINKGMGLSSSDEITYVNTYELYGPSNIAILVDTETDNTNRTLTDIKTYVHKAGGKMVPGGAISWQFEEMGKIELDIKDLNKEEVELEIIGFDGVIDIKEEINEEDVEVLVIYIVKEKFKSVSDEIKNKFTDKLVIVGLALIKKAKDLVKVTEEEYSRLEEFISGIDELNDVIKVWHNGELN